ncbi:heme exporter protein CcmD [Starkeya koreensis]|uniref:Heme exporter protein D n=1 Tax=Ancylobacter koreensis TaxID=266121 RepID=A0ABT0DLW8_9HYPH|nr:heme exporter protein CcmD [Ancylobacter koreensis]MCK0208275.1 heme exporter protein CcmD [Ancylobacter koreensis]
MLGEHGSFILACYGVSALVLGTLALWTVLDGRLVRRQLGELEARGVRRRSAGTPEA